MGTTSNGKPWGSNAGKVGGGIAYGWAAKKAIEAAQRREAQEGDTNWTAPVDAAKVGFLWVLFIGICIMQGYYMVNATVLIVTGFFDPMRDGNVTFGMWLLGFGLIGIGISLLTILASRALLARAEYLPPKRGERYLHWRFFPKTWLALYLLPGFAYLPFYFVNSHH